MLAAFFAQVHEGEQYYTFGWKELIVCASLVVIWLVLKVAKAEPGVPAVKMFINLTNSRGGNILVCLFLTIYFFSGAMRLFYHALGLVEAGKFDATNAVLMMGLQFVTGTAFGGAFGALLKTMSPENENGRTPLPGQVPGSTSSSSSTATTSSSSHQPETIPVAVAPAIHVPGIKL